MMEKKNKTHNKKDLLQKKVLAFFVVFVFAFLVLSRSGLGGENIFKDRDQDGLSDKEEIALGTDPDNPDTDGDGYRDGVEVEGGYDPLKPAPGDKLIKEPEVLGEKDGASNIDYNLTEEFLKKIKSGNSLQETENKEGDKNEIQGFGQEDLEKLQSGEVDEKTLLNNLVDEAGSALGENSSLTADDINIMPKPKGNNDEEIKKKEKKQIEEYGVKLLYTLSVNSPFEVSEGDDLQKKIEQFTIQMGNDIQAKDIEQIEEYRSSLKDLIEGIEQIEAPKVLAKDHLKILQAVNEFYNGINPNKLLSDNDPLAIYYYMGKMQGVLMTLEEALGNLQQIQEEYEINSINMSTLELGI